MIPTDASLLVEEEKGTELSSEDLLASWKETNKMKGEYLGQILEIWNFCTEYADELKIPFLSEEALYLALVKNDIIRLIIPRFLKKLRFLQK